MDTQIDEETPLLINGEPRATPLPWFQVSIVLFLHLAEPLTLQAIYPFAPQLIRELDITNGNESQVGYYVGLIQSVFFLSEACTVLHWSRISDRVGRKPVILTGLAGLSCSMYCFGLSTTLWGFVLSRCLNGALNGNIGVIRSVITEITDATNISQVYAYAPISWSTGGLLGSIIGGSLSHPVEMFPSIFGSNNFLKKYPYFLPCAVPATFTLVVWLVAFMLLKETHLAPTPIFEYLAFKKVKAQIDDSEEAQNNSQVIEHPEAEHPLPLRALLTRPVIVAAGNYSSLALLDISFRAIQPLFLSTPIPLGGLGLPPSTIGKLLAIYGIFNGAFHLFFFRRMSDRFGSKRVFTWGIFSTIPAFLSFPVINYLARHQGYSLALWTAVGFQIAASILINLSYGSIFIFIANASPNCASLGATNGLSQVSVSFMRAIGPATASSLFSLSIDKGYVKGQLVYVVLLGIVSVSIFIASLLPRHIEK